MANGWFVFATVASIVLCSGCILAIAIMRAAWMQRERETLTSEDLRALEESALFLIDQLKAEADQAASGLDRRRSALHELICEADARLSGLRDAARNQTQPSLPLSPESRASTIGIPTAVDPLVDRQRVVELASSGLECADIARVTGLGCGEVKLMLGLAKFPAN